MKQWPADSVERRPVASLVPYARNSRTHSDEQVSQIAASIREWGWTVPVLVDEDGTIIAGHGRVMAAQRLGLADVPCMVARGWTDAQRRAYVIADNKLALNAGWDEDLLKVELAELQGLDFDLGLVGFGEAEVDEILAQDEQIRETTKDLQPMSFTHALVSIPNGVTIDGWDEAVQQVIKKGGRVDYAGN